MKVETRVEVTQVKENIDDGSFGAVWKQWNRTRKIMEERGSSGKWRGWKCTLIWFHPSSDDYNMKQFVCVMNGGIRRGKGNCCRGWEGERDWGGSEKAGRRVRGSEAWRDEKTSGRLDDDNNMGLIILESLMTLHRSISSKYIHIIQRRRIHSYRIITSIAYWRRLLLLSQLVTLSHITRREGGRKPNAGLEGVGLYGIM